MSRCLRSATFAVLSILCCGASASAETLRCQSVNGNLNCAGSSGASCQTVNGKTVCVSGHGDAVQSFANGASPGSSDDDAGVDKDIEKAMQNALPGPVMKQYDPAGHRPLQQRDGTKLQDRTDLLPIDGD